MSVDSLVEIAGWSAPAVALLAAFLPRVERGLGCLRLYFGAVLLVDLTEFGVLQHFGLRSLQYRYAYYGCDLALTVLGYFVLARLVEVAFSRSKVRLPGLRLGAILLFTGVASCSAYIVYSLHGGFTTAHLGRELEQNFAFVGMILALVLAVGLNVIQIQSIRIRRVVLSFSVLYSAGAFAFSLAALMPFAAQYLMDAVPFISTGCAGLVAYSLIAPEPVRRERKATATALAGATEGAW